MADVMESRIISRASEGQYRSFHNGDLEAGYRISERESSMKPGAYEVSFTAVSARQNDGAGAEDRMRWRLVGRRGLRRTCEGGMYDGKIRARMYVIIRRCSLLYLVLPTPNQVAARCHAPA